MIRRHRMVLLYAGLFILVSVGWWLRSSSRIQVPPTDLKPHENAAPTASVSFPVVAERADLQLRATGWEWEGPESPRLVYQLSFRGEPIPPELIEDVGFRYEGASGEKVGSLLSEPRDTWKVSLELFTRPLLPKDVFQLGPVRISNSDAPNVLAVPEKLKQDGLAFAAAVGTRPFVLPEGSSFKKKIEHPARPSLDVTVHLEVDENGWRISGKLFQPHVITVNVTPATQRATPDLKLLICEGEQRTRANYRERQGVNSMICGTGPAWHCSKEFQGTRVTVMWWPLGKRDVDRDVAFEAFYVESHDFRFDVPAPPAPDLESLKFVLREYKVEPDIFRRFQQPEETGDAGHTKVDSQEAHLRRLFLNGVLGRMISYSPPTKTLLIRLPQSELQELEKKLARTQGL